MNLFDTIYDVRAASNPKTWCSLNEDIYNQLAMSNESYIDFLKCLENNGIQKEKIIILGDKHIQNVFYNPSDGVYINIMLDSNYFSLIMNNKFRKVVKEQVKQQKENRELKKYNFYFSCVPEPFRIYEFEKIYSTLTKEEKYNVWKQVYTFVDAGNGLWNEEILNDVFSHKPDCKHKFDDVLTIYRGVGSLSAPIEKAISWTLDINVAHLFAKNGEIEGAKIITAKVNAEDIIDYINEKEEKEVLVRYEDIFDEEEYIYKKKKRES